MNALLWNCESPVSDFDVDVPAWIEQGITCSSVAAILQGGCESGAYMPAVTYRSALETMGEHGDAVWDFIDDMGGQVNVSESSSQSWAGFACHFLSTAVELWASSVQEELEERLGEIEQAEQAVKDAESDLEEAEEELAGCDVDEEHEVCRVAVEEAREALGKAKEELEDLQPAEASE